MKVRALLAVLAGALLVPVAGAGAATRCVDPARDGCSANLAVALAAAQAGDRVEVAAGADASGPWTVSVALTIAGAPGAVLVGDLSMPGASELTGVTVKGTLELAGRASRVSVDGPEGTEAVRLVDGGALSSALVRGRGVAISAAAGTASADSVEVRVLAGDGVRAGCTPESDTTLSARHLTVLGEAADRAVAAECPHAGRSAVVELESSIVWGAFSQTTLAGQVRTAFTDHPVVEGVARAPSDLATDPGFEAAGDLRLGAGSPLLDAGDPGALAVAESVEDAGGLARVADGNGDGLVRRDIGAHERPAAIAGPAPGNVLVNAGAEEGTAGWTGGLVAERYGTFPFPSLETALALGAGGRFLAGGLKDDTTSRQVVDLSPLAPEIDGGGAGATLSALLGGYRADQDEGTVAATFRDPRGEPLATLSLQPVTPAQRANGITLLPRQATGAVPPLSRSVEVALRAVRRSVRPYADAYFDNVSLVLTTPGARPAPAPGGGEPGAGGGHGRPPAPGTKPFAGVTVLTARSTLDRFGRAPLRLACASATVGRCTGVVTLTTVPRAGRPARRLGSASFSVAAGRLAGVRVAIAGDARRRLRRQRQMKVRLYAAARDGQGQARATTSPLTLRRP